MKGKTQTLTDHGYHVKCIRAEGTPKNVLPFSNRLSILIFFTDHTGDVLHFDEFTVYELATYVRGLCFFFNQLGL